MNYDSDPSSNVGGRKARDFGFAKDQEKEQLTHNSDGVACPQGAGALGVAFLWIFRPSAVPFGVASRLAWARPAVDRELINDDARDI
ncbi:hypothetical protein CEXT_407811 [Caerostris extrusa]|uniref:Uncharacterized protein n=1 Tax=Caerostris extrusa TaxID=172846 RepID=A0AAV4MV38_CAEEX|nr:hypothetical protein CEXT_407811 [Caerostris extrusa]